MTIRFSIQSSLAVVLAATGPACAMFYEVPAAAIHEAALKGDIETIRRLVNDGADINAADAMGATPLYWAARGGHPMGPKLYFGMYFDMPPITQVTAKAQRVLKFKPTEFATGLKETYRWYLRHNGFPKPDYSFEDALLANAPVLLPAKV